ncbi:MAG: hypothetical protein QOH95_2885, partial [Gaiellaceae bacterium]|nr:hypothetical protein [Gaiellaceae bacterium]
PAVRAFFRNGGRRCFVVRVAGPDARAGSFAVPGLVGRPGGGDLTIPLLRARSEGRWSDDLRVAAALLESPVGTTRIDVGAWEIGLAPVLPLPITAGDLLRVSLRTAGYVAYVAVDDVDRLTARCDASTALWLVRRQPPASATGRAHFLDSRGAEQTADVRIERDPSSPAGDRVRVVLTTGSADLPVPGSLLHAVLGADDVWVAVGAVRVERAGSGPRGKVVELTGNAFWPADPPSRAIAPDPVATVEVCTFELWAQQGGTRARLGSLGFAPGHPRYAGGLPTDAQLYGGRATAPVLAAQPALWSAAADPRFPLAGPAESAGVLYPLGMTALPEPSLGALHAEATPLERDGLASFGPELFLDGRVAESGAEALLSQAEFIQLGGEPPLRGVHAALAIDDATIVAAPDAVQRPWTFVPPASVRVPRHRHPHRRRPYFEPCGRLHPPQLAATRPDAAGTFTLTWSGAHGATAFALEEARDPEFADAVELYRGRGARVDVFGRGRGAWYYRVRGERATEIGPWSTPVTVAIAPAAGWLSADDRAYDDATLVAVQTGLLRTAAARGDLFALLSLPGHYREDVATAHATRLRVALADGEERALGYGAVHHPWPTTSEAGDPTSFRDIPPDGTIAGVMARRALERGAWVAPANEPLRDVIALSPPVDRGAFQRLQDAQINVLRQEPHGFVVLDADTLSEELDFRAINVRRVLALLRRAALLHGTRYVFEPNDDALRRRIQRGFEDLLGLMYRLGAFAGATASEAFRVEVGDPPNSRPSIDAGRLIVELKVAPSLPLRFVTVRLVEHADRGLHLETV